MKHNYSNFSLTLLLSKYKMYVSRLQRHLDKGTFKGLSASRKNFLVRKVEELRARLQAMQFKVSGSIAAAGIATMLNVSTAEAQINFQENTAKNALALKHFTVHDSYYRESLAAAVDLNGDGKLDVIVSEEEDTYYYQNTGSTSAPAFSLITGSEDPFAGLAIPLDYVTYAFGDYDMDGDYDMIVGGGFRDVNYAQLRYFQNTGTATLPAFTELTGSNNPIPDTGYDYIGYGTPTVADIDGDSDLDIFLSNGSYDYGGNVLYFVNNPSVTTGSAPAVTPSWSLSTNSPFPNGNINPNGDSYYLWPGFVDVDGDGDTDAVFGTYYDEMFWYENIPAGTTGNRQMVLHTGSLNPFEPFIGYWQAPTFADFDGDGKYDMLLGEEDGVTIIYNEDSNGEPVFNPAINRVRFRTADLDGDADQDLIFSNNEVLQLRKNLGTASAPAYAYVPKSVSPLEDYSTKSFDFADTDGDGDIDAVLHSGYSSSFDYWLNDGTASAPDFDYTFGTLDPFDGVTSAYSSNANHAYVDLDGDGDFDLVQVEVDFSYPGFTYSSTFNYYKYEQVGTGTDYAFFAFTGTENPLAGTFDIGGNRPFIDFSDVDMDGDYDLLMGSNSDRLEFFLNTGSASVPVFALQSGSTSPFYSIAQNAYDPAPTFLDVDGDGDEDLYVGDQYGNIRLYENLAIVSSIAPSKANTFSAEIIAFPNPAKEQLNFSLDDAKGANLTVVVLDMQGTAVSTTNVVNNGGAMSVDVSALNPGVYALRLNSDSKSATVKFVKQ